METFTITENHIKLLQATFITWNSSSHTGAPSIDPKRPYGSSYAPRDIARILGIPLEEDEYYSDKAIELFKLHRETETALQIVLQLKTFEPGTFKVHDFSNRWERVKGG